MLVFNSTIFKQQLTDISTVLNNTGNTTQLLTSFTALDGVQQKVLLSSKLLSEEQKIQCATMATLSAANTKYTAEQIAKITGISAETLSSWGLTKSTDTLTISELAEKAASDSQAKSALEKIIAQNAQAVANGEVTASNITLTASENTATLATGAFTTAIKANISALKTWLFTTPTGWLTIAIGVIFAAVKAYGTLTAAVEKQKEKAEELISTYETALDTANSHKKSIDDVADRYEELAKGVNDLGENVKLTSEEYSEYNSIVNDIADMFPTMVQGYTEEGNAILKLKGNVDALREAYEAEAQAAYSTLIATGEDINGNDILKDANNVITGSTFGAHDWGNAEKIDYLDRLMNATSSVDNMLALWDESLNNAYRNWFEDFAGVSGTVNIGKLTNEDLVKIRKNAKILKQQYQAEINSVVDNTETLANAYLMTNEDYAKLDEQSKTAASIMVNSLNANIVSKFGEDKENVGKYVDDIVQNLLSNPNAKDAMIGLFTMDTSDMSVDDIEYWVNKSINTIANILDENPADLRIRLGFDDETTEPLKTKVQGFLKDEFDDNVGELTQEELETASKLEISEGTLLSWDELIKRIEEAQKQTSSSTSFSLSTSEVESIETYQKNIKTLSDALSDLNDLETTDITSLMTEFASYSSVFEKFGVTGVKGVGDLQGALIEIAAIMRDTATKAVPQMTDAIRNMFKAISNPKGDIYEARTELNALMELYNSISDSQSMDMQTATSLINKYPKLASAVQKVGEEYSFELGVVRDLVNEKIEYINTVSSYEYDSAIQEIATLEKEMEAYKSRRAYSSSTLGKYLDTTNIDADAYLMQDSTYRSMANRLKDLNELLEELKEGFSMEELEDTSSNDFEQQIDWAAQSVSNLSEKVSDLETVLDNTKGWEAQIEAIQKVIDAQENLQEGYRKSRELYLSEYNKALTSGILAEQGLSSSIKNKIESGSLFNIQDFIDEHVAKGTDKGTNEQIYDAIQKAMDWYDKYVDADNNYIDIGFQIDDNELEKLNIESEHLSAVRETLETALNGTISDSDKLGLLSQLSTALENDYQKQIEITKAERNTEEAEKLQLELKQELYELDQQRLELSREITESEIEQLEVTRTNIQNQIDLNGGKGTAEQYQSLIKNENDLLERRTAEYESEVSLLQKIGTEIGTNSTEYREQLKVVNECADGIAECEKNTKEWEIALLSLPLDELEEKIEELNKKLDDVNDKKSAMDDIIAGAQAYIQDEIDGYEELKQNIQDQI